MKFILVMYICSIVSNTCQNGYIPGYEFDSHYDCMIMGYTRALDGAKAMDPKLVNDNKLTIKFECRAVQVDEPVILPPPKPKVGT